MTKNNLDKYIPGLQYALLETIAKEIHDQSVRSGQWDKKKTLGEIIKALGEIIKSLGEIIIELINTELTSFLKTTQNFRSENIPIYSEVEETFANIVIRVLDVACGLKLDIVGAILAKVDYNESKCDESD